MQRFKMKFKSRIDLLHRIIYFATVSFLLGIVFYIWINNSESLAVNIWTTILCLGVSAFMIAIFSNSKYEIDSEFIHYQTGPIKGKIQINSVKEIEVNKTMWIGTLKPATALNGLIIKYNNFDEIYISPKTNEKFVEEILKINPEIKITRK